MSFRHFNIAEIAQILKTDISNPAFVDWEISTLAMDTRKVVSPEHSLFFALKTAKNDGHKYIAEAVNKDIKCFVVEYIPENIEQSGLVFLKVKDTLAALQLIAKTHRQKFDIPVIGITGSNGKTMVKEWLSILLEPYFKVVRNPKSYNSQIGVPLSVWEMNEGHEIAVFEAGISEPDEMEKLQKIIQPTIGIFTNIGSAHNEHFLNLTQKIAEKLRLFTKVERLIFCGDHIEINDRINSLESFRDIQFFVWSYKFPDADLYIHTIVKTLTETTLTATFNKEDITIVLPFTDTASIENLMHCWAFMLSYGLSNDKIAEGMKNLAPLEMRLELKEGINGCSIINDSYSSDFNSLQIALEFLNQQKQHEKHTVILSDMLQSGRAEIDLYEEIAKLLEQKNVNRIIGIGSAISSQTSVFKGEKDFFPDTETFLSNYNFDSFNNETILLKGARVFAFEKINAFLQQKTHETVLEINLNAMQHNLNYFRSKLKPSTKIMSMVKAFSYGSGSFEISNLLQFNNIDYLTVAYADEGIELRNFGIELPIMVMNPEEVSFGKILRFRLEPEIYNFRTLHQLIAELNKTPHISEVFIHLKMDTGMHRLGFIPMELPELITELKANPKIKIKSIFSHLSGTGNPALDEFTRKQIRLFEEMSDAIMFNFNYSILRHILNSAGISRFPEAQFDMVRLGIGLYGVGATPEDRRHLENVSTLKSTISQIKIIPTNDSVGYDRQFIAGKDHKIGIISIGYADGLSRRLGNGKGFVLVNGHNAPIIGNICMDMSMIDLTGISANEGDQVVVFGKELPVQDVAAICGTIPYEVLTGISRRVKRVYYQE